MVPCITFHPLAPCKGAIQFLVVIAFLGQGNSFEDLRRRSEEHPMPIDCSLLQVAHEDMSDLQYLGILYMLMFFVGFDTINGRFCFIAYFLSLSFSSK